MMRRAPWLLPALLVALGGAASAQAPGAPVGSKAGPLSRLDGRLQQAYAEDALGAAARVAGGVAAADGSVAVDVTAADGDGAALQARLEALGLQGGAAYGAVVSGRLPVSALGALAALDGVRGARAVQAVTHARRAGRGGGRPAASPVFVGAVTGEASRALRVQATRDALGVSGSGIRMGVLSDSYNQCSGRTGEDECETTAQEDVASGDLPAAGARVLDAGPDDGSDEGRAMMQLALDVAPGLAFSFHSAFGGQASFAQGIQDLADDGAHVIVDDVLIFTEPFFQDGVVAQAVSSVVGRGVVYVSSAGNAADQAYESNFRSSGRAPRFRATSQNGTAFTVDEGDLHDFDPGPAVDTYQSITLAPDEGVTLVFQYAEPSFSATCSARRLDDPGASCDGIPATTSDYDIYIVDRPSPTATVLTGSNSNNNIRPVRDDDGNLVLDADGNVITGSGEPVEILSYTNESGVEETVQLAIVKFSGERRFMKYIDFDGQATFEYAQSGNSTSVAHNNAAAALNVGAAAWFNTPAFNDGIPAPIVNSFSAYGGSRVFFDAEGNAVDEDREKPDVVGSDGDNNTFLGFDGGFDDDAFPNFFGTSAAAPNVAAVAALMLDAAGGPESLAPLLVVDILEDTALDIAGPFNLSNGGVANFDTRAGYDARSGAGFVRGDRALDLARAVPNDAAPPAAAFRIASLGPNPSGSTLALAVETDVAQALSVALYDVLGRRVAVLYDGPARPGAPLALRADVRGLPSGAYLVRVDGEGRSLSRPVTVAH